jgi:uncharacterized protein
MDHAMDDAPLSEADFDRLDRALAQRPEEMGDLSLSAADGFIAGVALSPEFIAPREWMAALFGEAEGEDKAEAAAVSALAWRRHNAILAGLRAGAFEPLLERDEDGWALGEIWAEGFLMAMDLRPESWEPILAHPAAAELMLPVLALGDPRTLADIEPRKAKRSREAARLTALLPIALPALERIADALREGRGLEAPDEAVLRAIREPAAQERSAPKAGRNDPCPCGSGLKFKKCCGAAG